MSEQALDLRRSMRIVRRHRSIVGVVAGLGLVAGAAFTVLHPPMLTSKALVVLPSSASKYIGTQVVIAGSNPVLAGAMRGVGPPVSLQTLRSRVQVRNLTSNLIAISGQGKTATEAEGIANAVANSYVAYARSPHSAGGQVKARVLESATNATGTSRLKRTAIFGGLGILAGVVIGVIVALAIERGDRRLRERDEISDSIGVPVLASLPVRHPSDATGWAKLLDDYKPGAVQAWSLRKALQHLGLTGAEGNGASVAVLSLSSDRGSLALGPQLAVYAASLGVPTALVIGPQQDANVAATLRAACAAPPSAQSKRSRWLRVSVRDHEGAEVPNAPLTVVVSVVDAQVPQVAVTMRATATVLGVSAGVATAEQMARVAVSAAGDGRQIAGILVADPDPDRPHDWPPSAADSADTPETTGTPGRRDNGEHIVSDGDRMMRASLNGGDDLAERFPAYDDFTVGDEPETGYSTGIPTLHFITAALRRSVWLWCATAAVGLVIGLGVFAAHPPPFKASASVVLVPNPDELPTDAILTDVALAQSRTVAERAMHQLGLPQSGQSASSFLAGYTVTPVTDRVLVITVKAPSSSEAVSHADALATAFLQFRAQQAQSQEQHVLAALQQQVSQAKQHIKSLGNEIVRLRAQPASPGQRARLASLQAQLSQANSQLPSLQQAVTSNQVGTRLSGTQMVRGSAVLDRAAPIPHSRFKLPTLYAVGGLLAGLVLGMGFVIVRAVVSDRLRRRDDVAHALGAPVRLSVGAVRLGGLLGRRGLAAAEGGDIRRIVAHLHRAVPRGAKRAAALAVVAVDEADVAALSLTSLAVSAAAEGKRVVLADLCGEAPAAKLVGVKEPGVRAVKVKGAQLVVAVLGRESVAPVGPLRGSPAAPRQRPSRELAAACESADLLLTLARLDPSIGGEHLATWASDAVVMVTAGRSSWTKIHAVGEMIRLAGLRLASAVLVGADKTDESLGVTHTPTPPAPAAASKGH